MPNMIIIVAIIVLVFVIAGLAVVFGRDKK